MAKFGKWIGGGLGFAMGGPLGALFGFALGNFIDNVSVTKLESGRATQGDFTLSLLALIAAVLKADGKVMKSELDYVKQFLVQSFGKENANQLLPLLKESLKKDINLQEIAYDIKQHMQYQGRHQIVHFLLALSLADGEFHPNEKAIIKRISALLGITPNDEESLFAMFIKDTDSAYKILGVGKSATNDQIKKAYRKMAKEHHPDKVAHLGDSVREKAKEKFQKIQQAYEDIKKERNL